MNCPECDASLNIPEDAAVGEIVPCPNCGADYEIAKKEGSNVEKNMINLKYKIGNGNSYLDLTQDKVKFFVDHLFILPNTIRSFVFFPYDLEPDKIHYFNEYCKSNDYRIIFVGGESQYGGKSKYTNGTMTILLIHKDDDHRPNFLSCLEKLNQSS